MALAGSWKINTMQTHHNLGNLQSLLSWAFKYFSPDPYCREVHLCVCVWLHGCRNALCHLPPLISLDGKAVTPKDFRKTGCWNGHNNLHVLCLSGLVWVKAQSSQEARGRQGAMLVTLIWCLKVCLPQKYEDTFQNLIGMATCDSLSTSSFFPPIPWLYCCPIGILGK